MRNGHFYIGFYTLRIHHVPLLKQGDMGFCSTSWNVFFYFYISYIRYTCWGGFQWCFFLFLKKTGRFESRIATVQLLNGNKRISRDFG